MVQIRGGSILFKWAVSVVLLLIAMIGSYWLLLRGSYVNRDLSFEIATKRALSFDHSMTLDEVEKQLGGIPFTHLSRKGDGLRMDFDSGGVLDFTFRKDRTLRSYFGAAGYGGVSRSVRSEAEQIAALFRHEQDRAKHKAKLSSYLAEECAEVVSNHESTEQRVLDGCGKPLRIESVSAERRGFVFSSQLGGEVVVYFTNGVVSGSKVDPGDQ